MTIPSLGDLLNAFGDGVRGRVEPDADARRGSVYDHWAGAGAILFAREASRDRDLFRAIHFDTAEGQQLAAIGRRRYGVEPIVASFGQGTATLVRDSTAAGDGTVFAGTRIAVLRRSEALAAYAVAKDVTVAAEATRAVVPVRATTKGSGVAIRAVVDTETLLRLDDPLWDPTWRVVALECADGADDEDPNAYRARARQAQLDRRRGYAKSMSDACVAAGAAHVALFASTYAGDEYDSGLNVCYVGDAGRVGSDMLVRRCAVALERLRVLGADLQVLPMRPAPVRVRMIAPLWDDPAAFNTTAIGNDIRGALSGYFEARTTAYGFALDAMAGAALAASDALQDVAFLEPATSASVVDLSSGVARFPAALSRYTLAPNDIAIRFTGPAT